MSKVVKQSIEIMHPELDEDTVEIITPEPHKESPDKVIAQLFLLATTAKDVTTNRQQLRKLWQYHLSQANSQIRQHDNHAIKTTKCLPHDLPFHQYMTEYHHKMLTFHNKTAKELGKAWEKPLQHSNKKIEPLKKKKTSKK